MVEYVRGLIKILQNLPEPSGGMTAPLDAPGHGLILDEGAVTRF
jgi:hypothetical protein